MLTEILNDKKFRIFLIVLVVGIMATFMAVPDCIALSKPATDITNLWDADLSALKNNAHISMDITLVWDNIGSEIETRKTMGVTTSSKETAYYYLIPLISNDNNDYVYPYPFLVAKLSSRYSSLMTKQIELSDAWWENNSAGFDTVPVSGIHLDGRLKKMPSKMRNALEETLAAGEAFEDYYIPYVFEPIAVPSAPYIMLAVGIVCLLVSGVILFLMIRSIKDAAAFAPTQKNYEYYGPQGAETPYQGGYSTTARTAQVANNAPTVKDMVSGAFATSSMQLPPTTPATPFANKQKGIGSGPVLTSLKQPPVQQPQPQPVQSPFITPAGANAAANPLYGGTPVIPAGADAAMNPLYGGTAAPTTPEEYVSPLANQSGNVNFNPAYGQVPVNMNPAYGQNPETANMAPAQAQVLPQDALAANSQFLGTANMDPMLAQSAPVAPPVNPLEANINVLLNGPAPTSMNPALMGQPVAPSPYNVPNPAKPFLGTAPSNNGQNN